MIESEFILLRQFASNGDAEAFAKIIKQHAPMVYGVCLRILQDKDKAADAVQDTFFQLIRDAAEITGSLPNWLHRVATYRAIDLIRTDSQRKQRESIYTDNYRNIISQNEKAAWREISGYIDEELDNLDELTREVLILHFFEGQTMTSIGEKFGISQQTVSRRIDSGVVSLRQNLKSRGVIVPAAILSALLMENIVQAAPASIMRELGKIALSGGKTATNVQISSGLSVAKAKIIALSTAAIFIIGSVILYINLSLATESEIIAQGKPAIQTPPDVNELLDKFASNQKILASFIATTEMTSDYTVSIVKGKNFHSESLTKLVIDENRAYVNYTMWGDVSPTDHYEKDIPYHKSQWWDGIGHYMYDRPNPNDFSTMAIRLNADKKYDVREKIFSGYCSCSFGMGYLPQNNGRIDEIIRKAATSYVREQMENIGDSDCYVIEAKAKTGSHTIWIDPSHSYNVAKAEVRKGPRDMLANGYVLPENDSLYNFVNNVKFKKIDDVWVPVEADYGSERVNLDNQKSHYKITEIELNPDHKALGSFIPSDISNGTIVMIADEDVNTSSFLPGSYTWQDGKVVDINGREVDLENLGPLSLIGEKAIAKLVELNIMPDFAQIKDKILLICFWDMDQRPSRNTILSLNKRAEALLEKGLYMIFIHTGAIEERTFTSWLKSNEILPPVGVSNEGLPTLGYTWGVQSLPWLILTDKNHVVTDEGFSINELDEKIKN